MLHDAKTTKRMKMVPEGLEFRMGNVTDIPAILELQKEFFALTQFDKFGIEVSDWNSEKYLTMLFEHNFAPHIFAFVDGRMVGWLTYSYDISYFRHPIAVLNTIFVTKKYRRTAVARLLLDAAMNMAKEDMATAFFAPVNSGSPHIQSLGNMLSKAGFEPSGYIMSRRL